MTELDLPPVDQARFVRVIDVETSGLPEDEQHALVEIGWVDLNLATMTIGNPVTMLVNPGHTIPAHIRAIHHISDEMVADAITPAAAVAKACSGMSLDDVFCAHSSAFERQFIGEVGRRWICTLKAAYRAWPELRSHSNQALRYEFGIDVEPDFDSAAAMPPHRALPDAWTTAFILRRLLQLRPLARLIELEGLPTFMHKFGFGKHFGKTFEEVSKIDASYLEWIVDKSELDEGVKYTARYWLGKRSLANVANQLSEQRYLNDQGDR